MLIEAPGTEAPPLVPVYPEPKPEPDPERERDPKANLDPEPGPEPGERPKPRRSAIALLPAGAARSVAARGRCTSGEVTGRAEGVAEPEGEGRGARPRGERQIRERAAREQQPVRMRRILWTRDLVGRMRARSTHSTTVATLSIQLYRLSIS